MTEKRVMGIDPGTEHVGWCVGEGRRYVASGTLSEKGGDAWERLPKLWKRLSFLVEAWEPELIVAEEPKGHHRNLDTDRKLGAAYAMPFFIAFLNGAEFERVHPLRVKKTGFHKKALKECAEFTGKEFTDKMRDEADAIGVWALAVGVSYDEWASERWQAEMFEEGAA